MLFNHQGFNQYQQPGMVNNISNINQIPQQQQMVQNPVTIYTQLSTRNKSFLKMHYYLRDIGIPDNKNAFMLALFDPDLAGVNPYDPRLNQNMKLKILKEVMINYWYYLREVVRLPSQGGVGEGEMYNLHRGNLAFNFLVSLNINTYLELPRQQGKTLATELRLLWVFNYGTTNSYIGLFNKDGPAVKESLGRIKKYRELLPTYLRMDTVLQSDGKKGRKAKDTVERLDHTINKNIMVTFNSSQNKNIASNRLRGKTVPLLWFDEHAFIKFIKETYLNGVPAMSTAMRKARENNVPHGVMITTTPGDLTTDEGIYSFKVREDALEFDESWYGLTAPEIYTMISNNTSNFVHVKFSYKQLGLSEKWFEEQCKELQYDYDRIKSELLLEWSVSNTNSPFKQEDLDTIGRLVKDHTKIIRLLNGKYCLYVYDGVPLKNNIPKYPPIIGVDVATGRFRDSSAITIIDSYTTNVFAVIKNNKIEQDELAALIYEIVTKLMPNAIVNIESNGGFGQAVIATLRKTKIKKNLYFEIKDKLIEEYTENNIRTHKKKKLVKVYGLNSTKKVREVLIDILGERVEHHKDKFISRMIYNELIGMEQKRNGKVEHGSNTHDDLVFSYLMALYVWYEGKNINQWNIRKNMLVTDEDIEEPVEAITEETGEIVEEIEYLNEELDEKKEAIKNTINEYEKISKSYMTNEQFIRNTRKMDDEILMQLIATNKVLRNAYQKRMMVSDEEIEDMLSANNTNNTVVLNHINQLNNLDFDIDKPQEDTAEKCTFKKGDFFGHIQ